MTESRAPRAGDQSEGAADGPAGDQADEVMLTTGEAAEVIGYGTTRKKVILMISDGEIAYVRHKRGAWARIPLSAALAKRRDLEQALAESKALAIRKRGEKLIEEGCRRAEEG